MSIVDEQDVRIVDEYGNEITHKFFVAYDINGKRIEISKHRKKDEKEKEGEQR